MDWNEKETILGVKGVTGVTYLIFVIFLHNRNLKHPKRLGDWAILICHEGNHLGTKLHVLYRNEKNSSGFIAKIDQSINLINNGLLFYKIIYFTGESLSHM